MRELIGIVIVNYNGEKFQNECIESILASDYDNYRIIVVDNNSTDNSMKLLQCYNDERIICIFEKENYGVAKGNNIGIKKSIELGCKYTMLLNNDTVLKPDAISRLYFDMNGNDVSVPLILFYGTDLVWYGGGRFVRHKCVTEHLNYKKVCDGLFFEPYYEYAPTCCMLIKNEVFNKIGVMDEEFFLYFDDTDFCMRLMLNDIKIAFCKESTIYHKVSLSTGGKLSKTSVYYENRNRYYFYDKYKDYYPWYSYVYLHTTRLLKYLNGVLFNNNNKLIKKAILDYKNGKLGRCDNL